MIRLVCEDNFLEYAGQGYFQCGRHVKCPKDKNNKILGFDCVLYIDNLPEGYKLIAIEQDRLQDKQDNTVQIETAPIKKEYDITIEDSHHTKPENESGNIDEKAIGGKLVKSEQIFIECK